MCADKPKCADLKVIPRVVHIGKHPYQSGACTIDGVLVIAGVTFSEFATRRSGVAGPWSDRMFLALFAT